MKIGILPVGETDTHILMQIKENLDRVFPDTTCLVIDEKLNLRDENFDKKRKQYRSNAILSEIQGYAAKKTGLNRILGVVNADLFIPELNFVFGEAVCPGKVSLISLWRLNPEFYGDASNVKLFSARALKEAVHELGHTLGLRHCSRSSCVMHFSNSVSDTDIKQSRFCDECYLHVTISISKLR